MSAPEALARLEAAVLASAGQGQIQLGTSDALLIANALRAASEVQAPRSEPVASGPEVSLADIERGVQDLFTKWERKP
jgi:hypothetical protein